MSIVIQTEEQKIQTEMKLHKQQKLASCTSTGIDVKLIIDALSEISLDIG